MPLLTLIFSRTSSSSSLLASASRDRLIHVFNVNRDYSFLSTLDDHSSSITAIKFIHRREGIQQQNENVQVSQEERRALKSSLSNVNYVMYV